MITEPLIFTGKLTLEETLDLHRYHFRCVLRPSIRVLMGVVSLLIAALAIYAGFKSEFSPGLLCILALCAQFPFGWLALRRYSISWAYRRHPERVIEHTATLTNDSVSLSNAHMETRLDWDRLELIVVTPRGVLFLVQHCQPFFWLPQRLLEGSNHRAAIVALAAENKITVRVMN